MGQHHPIFNILIAMGIITAGATVAAHMAGPQPARPARRDVFETPGFLDLVKSHLYLLSSENRYKTYAIDPGHKLLCTLEMPVYDRFLHDGGIEGTSVSYVGKLPRFLCVDHDEEVADGCRHSASEAFAIVAKEALGILAARPDLRQFYAPAPQMQGYIKTRLYDRQPSLN